MKIISCKIGPMPRPMPQGMFDPKPEVNVKFQDGSSKNLFTFYPDEISFDENEFIGLTEAEALTLRTQKDTAYLQSK